LASVKALLKSLHLHPSDIETLWINPEQQGTPLVVFLHEGLGSVALWRDFPRRFCDAMNVRGLVFSRKGYGQSTPRSPYEHWPVDFMHSQATVFLPVFFESVGIDPKRDPPILFGHSDGATIALIYAATYPSRVRSVIALAPHIMIESVTIESIRQGKLAYETPSTQLKAKLSRYHADVDSAFYGWCNVWLSSAFQSFDIRALLPNITCPLLAVQGTNRRNRTGKYANPAFKAYPLRALAAYRPARGFACRLHGVGERPWWAIMLG
jgi:pimeloyl-ACP methyl ester carboxylesterase